MTRASDTAKLLGAGATILDGTTISTADNTSQLTLTSTDADSSVGPVLDLVRDSASPADGDAIGQIKFIADNDASEATTYSSAFTTLRDASNGAEDGQTINYVMTAGALVDHLRMGRGSANGQSEVVINEGSVDMDFRVESNGNANMLFVEGSTDRVAIGHNAPTAQLHVAGSGQQGIGIGSTNAGGAYLYLDGDSNGDFSGSDYSYIGHNTDGILDIHQDSPSGTNEIRFYTESTERFRLKNSEAVFNEASLDIDFRVESDNHANALFVDGADGTFSINGTTTGGDMAKINNSSSGFVLNLNNASASDNILISSQSGTGTVIHHQLNNSNGLVGKITTNGSTTTYATSSDYRIKENVSYNFDATTRLKQLKPARFNFIPDETNTLVDGFIAHEVSSIVPEAVIGEKDATETYTDDDGNEQTRISPQAIDQSKLVPLLVKTIQELEARITALES